MLSLFERHNDYTFAGRIFFYFVQLQSPPPLLPPPVLLQLKVIFSMKSESNLHWWFYDQNTQRVRKNVFFFK